MVAKIVRQPDNFLILGMHRGFQLTVDCSEQLRRFNERQKLDDEYFHLLEGFSAAYDSDSLHPSLIDEFNHHYWLHRHPVFEGERFARRLAQYLDEIRNLPPASGDSIVNICKRFGEFREKFSRDLERERNPLPEISLSKLLHCLRPVSFWILDSRVQMVLDIWGYPTSYSGFGRLLTDLFQDREVEGFKTFLKERDRQVASDRPPCSFLKLLDKVLWFPSDKEKEQVLRARH